MTRISCSQLKSGLRNLVQYIVDFNIFLEDNEITSQNIDQFRSLRDRADEQSFKIWRDFYPGLDDLMEMHFKSERRIVDDQRKPHELRRDAWKWFHEYLTLDPANRRVEMEKDMSFNFLSHERLPRDFTLKGNFNMDSHCEIDYLPEGLHIEGGVTIYGKNIKNLPKGLKVMGDLRILDTVEDLPDDLRVGGTFFVPKKLQDKAWKLDSKGFINRIAVE